MDDFEAGDRVVVEDPRRGRHYGTVVAPYEASEPAFIVRVDGTYVNPDWTVLRSWMHVPLGQCDMVIGDLLNTEMLKEQIEVPFLGTLWTEGDSGMLKPYVCECSFGDGMQMLRLFTINQRPNYHVVRVDSGWDDNDILEAIDEIKEAIEEECGRAGVCLDEPCDTCEDTVCCCSDDYSADEAFPALDDRNGCSWSRVSWSEMMRKIGYSAIIDRLVPALPLAA